MIWAPLVEAIVTELLALTGRVLNKMGQTFFLLSFLIAAACSFGWMHRVLWYLMESEASKVLNGAMVTVGSFRVDLVRGRLWASNIIVHSPRRKEWKWESPVFARIGHVYIEANTINCLFRLYFFGEDLPLEMAKCHLRDIQVFIERKQHIFNFYLLDPHNVIPDSSELEDDHAAGDHESGDITVPTIKNSSLNEETWDVPGIQVDGAVEQERAQKMVDEMVKAVQSMYVTITVEICHHSQLMARTYVCGDCSGRAARRGSLHETLTEQRQNITLKLRELKGKKKSEAMQEGVKIVQQVSKAVVEKTQHVQVKVARRKIPNEKVVLARVGCVVLDNMRIFTRDYWDEEGRRSEASSWNKPIVLRQTALRPVDLCPPLSALDDLDLPMLYQPVEKIFDVIMKRLLADVAKSNTSRLFQTAFGEVVDLWVEQDVPASDSV